MGKSVSCDTRYTYNSSHSSACVTHHTLFSHHTDNLGTYAQAYHVCRCLDMWLFGKVIGLEWISLPSICSLYLNKCKCTFHSCEKLFPRICKLQTIISSYHAPFYWLEDSQLGDRFSYKMSSASDPVCTAFCKRFAFQHFCYHPLSASTHTCPRMWLLWQSHSPLLQPARPSTADTHKLWVVQGERWMV